MVRQGSILLLAAGSVYLGWCLKLIWAQDRAPSPADDHVIAAGKTQSTDVPLHAGEFLQFDVEQQGGKVTATLIAPDGTEAAYGSTIGLTGFHVAAIANTSGTYHVEIHAFPRNPDAHYRLTVSPPRIPSPEDKSAAQISSILGAVNKRADQAMAAGNTSATLQTVIDGYGNALEVIRTLKNPEAEGQALLAIATAHQFAGGSGKSVKELEELDAAVDAINQAIPIFHMLGDWRSESEGLFLKTQASMRRGRDLQAIESAEYLAAESEKHADLQNVRRALNVISTASNHAGLIDQSITAEQRLLKLESDAKSEASAQHLVNIAALYLRLGDTRSSLAYRQNAADIYESLGRKGDLADALYRLARGNIKLGDIKNAGRYYDRMIQIAPGEDSPDLLIDMGRTDVALKVLLQKLDSIQERIAAGARWTSEESSTWSVLSGVYTQLHQPEMARNALEHAFESWPDANDPDNRIEFLAGVAGGYLKLGDYPKALELYREYERLILKKGPKGFPNFRHSLAAWRPPN
jgi:tetratricopeptide (TPR) repeat protein